MALRNMHRIRRVLCALICGAWTFTGPIGDANAFEPGLPGSLTPDFIQFFDTLALTADYGPFNNRPPWVRKWSGPVRIVLDPSAEVLRGEIETLSARLSGWAGIPFTVAPPDTATAADTWNVITVQLLRRRVFQRLYNSRDVVCQTETHGVGGALQVGYMVLSEGYTDCLKHEFMHALGFDSHWNPAASSDIRSVLAYRESAARSEDFTRWDIMAIRVLYDGRIRAGMTRQKSLRIAYEMIGGRPQEAALPADVAGQADYR